MKKAKIEDLQYGDIITYLKTSPGDYRKYSYGQCEAMIEDLNRPYEKFEIIESIGDTIKLKALTYGNIWFLLKKEIEDFIVLENEHSSISKPIDYRAFDSLPDLNYFVEKNMYKIEVINIETREDQFTLWFWRTA